MDSETRSTFSGGLRGAAWIIALGLAGMLTGWALAQVTPHEPPPLEAPQPNVSQASPARMPSEATRSQF